MRSVTKEQAAQRPYSVEEELRRVMAQRDRLQSELELRNCAMDAAASHFMITDATRRGSPIVYVNEALARDHGYSRHELIGVKSEMLIPRDLNPEQYEQIRAAARAGESLRLQVRSRRKDGSEFWAGVFMGPVRNNAGHVTHYVSIGTDITARREEEENKRRLQEQLLGEMQERERMAIQLRFAQKLEAVGQLAAGIAHEINTPIQYVGDSISFLQQAATDCRTLLETYRASLQRVIQGADPAVEYTQVAQVEASVDLPFLEEEVPKAFDRTLAGVDRVARIVRAMKEFAHSDAGEQSAADINHAIETTLTVSRNEYKYVAAVETEFAALPEVVCNIGELNQVFLNLIVNSTHAIAATGQDASTGRIAISTALTGSYVVVTVEDNGCGIPHAHLERIFDPFFTTKEVGKGTGQGLAISRAIVVDKHGGTIDVDSKVGEGTRFVVTLPIAGRLPATGRAEPGSEDHWR